MPTLAIHIIFTTYGTWLPGDKRGHWSPLFDFYGHLLRAGHQLNISDPTSLALANANLTDEPKTLQFSERALASLTFRNYFRFPELPSHEHTYTVTTTNPGKCRGYLKPLCHAAAIEENHVHLLTGPIQENLDRFVGRLKGTSSSQLKLLPQNKTRHHLWTAKFWRVFLFDPIALHAVRKYITTHNTRRHLSPDPYDFITPP